MRARSIKTLFPFKIIYCVHQGLVTNKRLSKCLILVSKLYNSLDHMIIKNILECKPSKKLL